MAEKRRGPGRPRGEGPRKRRITEIEQEEQIKQPSASPVNFIEQLSLKIADGVALPAIARSALLPNVPVQSIPESGVLEASLRRSRNAWLNENIFERYWTKPTKKKGQPENPYNPPKESMQKIGHCRVTIEPHVFQASLFSIRTWPPSSTLPTVPVQQAVPLTPVVSQTPTPQSAPVITTPTPNLSTTISPLPIQPSIPAAIPRAEPTPVIPIQGAPAQDLPITTSAPAQTPLATTTNLPPLVNNSASIAAPSLPLPTPKPSQDPVIQMLAQRASTNPELKVLMKIVAAGNATGEQLRVFQGHIDELTGILHRQTQLNNFLNSTPQTPAGTTAFRAPFSSNSSLFSRPQPPPVSYNQPQKFQLAPQIKPKPPPPPKDVIIGVAMEFSGYAGERYLFPKHCILESSLDGKQLTASFLVVRKGKVLEGSDYDSSLEYYQPVTLRLTADHNRAFESIYRTVPPVDDVIKYMEDIMSRAQRARTVRLVMKLPTPSDVDGKAEPTLAGEFAPSPVARRKSTMSGAPGIGGTGIAGRGSRRRSEDSDSRCQYCFASVPAQHDGKKEAPTCSACIAFVAPATRPFRSAMATTRKVSIREATSSGPRTLMLAVDSH